ncbi:unnamed protein product [Urochloa humidicola]
MATLSKESQEQLQAWLELWHQASGFIKSMALAVALDLGIADAIHRRGGAATLSQIQEAAALSPSKLDGLRRLMRVLTVSGTFASTTSSFAVYKLTPASRLLVAGIDDDDDGDGPRSMSPLLTLGLGAIVSSPFTAAMAAWLRQDEQEPCPYALAHGGKSIWERAAREAPFNALFNDAMASDSHFTMRVVVRDCGEVLFRGISSLVDVAGGVGATADAIASAFPDLKCTVLDLPHVVAGAPSYEGRVRFVAGDMFQSIPHANAIFLKWILHDWGDEDCVKILKNCKQAIPPKDAGGKVIIIDMVVGYGSQDIKYIETQVLYDLLLMFIGGVEWDEQEWKKIFSEAGFQDYKIIPVLGVRSIIELYP